MNATVDICILNWQDMEQKFEYTDRKQKNKYAWSVQIHSSRQRNAKFDRTRRELAELYM